METHRLCKVPPKKKIRRKVVCVFGTFDETSDFVLEPVCPENQDCEYCKDSFWIELSEDEEK